MRAFQVSIEFADRIYPELNSQLFGTLQEAMLFANTIVNGCEREIIARVTIS
jgi:hypothetical protein